MSGHRKFWASLWCHISTVSLVFKFSRAFLEIFRNVFTPTTSVMKFWSLCDTIFLWCTGSGSLGPVVPITGLLIFGMFWLDLERLSLDQGGGAPGTRGLPSAFHRNGRSAASSPGCSYQIFGSQFEVIFLLHYSVTSVSDCFCFSMGATDSCYTRFYFWNLCYIFFLFQKIFLYTVWRRKTFIQRTEFFLGWILSRERASSQGHMFSAAGPVKLDLNLEDFLEPGVRQLWRSNWWSYGWVWGLSGTSFPPPADLQVSGKWRGQDCCWCGGSLRITCPDPVLSLSN